MLRSMLLRSIFGAALALGLSLACLARAAAPPPGVQLIADVPYGPGALQRMDVYRPAVAAQAGAPVIFMVHGGGWRRGDKAMANVVQNKVARWVPQGVVFVSVNYRLLPEASVAEQAHDVALALAAAQRRAAAWGGDAGKFILMGHSAGAHLVALINAQPAFAQRMGAWPWLGSVALDGAMYNVPERMREPHLPLYDAAFGSHPAYWVALSPYHQLVAGTPPYLFVCSTERPDDPCRQSAAMARRVRELGGRAEVLPQDLSHGEINDQLGLEGAYTRAVEAFMASLDALVARRLARPGE